MKEVRHVVGMMSGTSVDGVDAALVEISGTDSEPKVKLLAFENKPYPPQVREKIFSLFTPANATVDKVGYMNFLLGEIYAKSALSVIEKAGMKPEEIDVIGSHGQTIWHAPIPESPDGTLCEAVDELCYQNVTLYVVPGGTGNDFARAFGLPKDPLAAFERQLAGTPVQIDCGRVNGRGFLNVSGSGFDVDVLQKTEELKKVYSGEKAYHKAVISVLGRYKAFEAELSVDGKPATHEACTIIEIANGQYIGGGMRVAPEAEMDDGMFDVVVVRKVPRMCIPFLLPLFMLGWHTKLGLARVMRAKRVSLRAKGMTLNVDGKLVTADHADYELLPGAIRMMRP